MTNQCIKCKKEIGKFYDLCTDCSKDAYAENIFWIACDPLITKPVVDRFREHSEVILTIGDGTDEILFEQGKTVDEEIESFEPENKKEYKIVHEKMNSILGEMGVTKDFDKDNYLFSKKDVKIFSKLFLKIEKIEHQFSGTEGISALYLRFGNLFFYNALKSDVSHFEPEFRKKIVNDLCKEAEGFYTLAIRSDDKNPTAHKNIGKLLLEKDDYERAIDHIKISLEQQADTEAIKLLIKAMIHSDKQDEAEKKLDELDKDEDYLILKGDIHKHKGGWGRAIQLYQESGRDEGTLKVAKLFLANERYRKALEAYSKYLDENEQDHSALKGKAECLFELERLEDALEDIRKSISLDPQDDKKWEILGKIHKKDNNKKEAKEAFKNAVKLNPENKDIEKRLKDL
ncbi:MAG: tetratricopeptide repeat protein [Thermoplasmatota archaeon]